MDKDEAWHISPLGQFMHDHPEKVQEVMDAAAGDWNWIARTFAIARIHDHTGDGPTVATVRETWTRVEARRREQAKLRTS